MLISAKIPIEEHIWPANSETKFLRISDREKRDAMETLRESTLIDDLLMPIGGNSTAKGYFRAVKGLMESNETEVIAGCTEEITAKGRYRIECQIIFIYASNIYTFNADCLDLLVQLIENRNLSSNLRANVVLCFAYFILSLCVNYIFCGDLEEAEMEYAKVFDMLNGMEERGDIAKHKIYIIKSGAIQNLVGMNALDALSRQTANQIRRDLVTCCELMPNFYAIHMQRYYAESNIECRCMLIKKLKAICDRFPRGIGLRSTYILELSQNPDNMEEAKRELAALRESIPDKIDETWWIEATLNEGQPASVELFKRAIDCQPFNGLSFWKLGEYFESVTHEYAKALEVYNKGLRDNYNRDKFRKLFNARQNLLSKISAEKYWKKL